MLRRLGDLWVLFIQVEITGSLGVYLTQQAAKLQIENFGLPPFFFLFLSFKCTSMVFFSLGYIYISWIMLLRTSCNNPV